MVDKRGFLYGAGDGSRTHLRSLGSFYSTDKLRLHICDSLIIHRRKGFVKGRCGKAQIFLCVGGKLLPFWADICYNGSIADMALYMEKKGRL